jgi:hypothetical protein
MFFNQEMGNNILDDRGMQVEGNIQKNVGKAQAGYSDLKGIKEGKENEQY